VVVAILYLLIRGLISLGAFYGLWSDRQRRKRRMDKAAMTDIGRLTAALASTGQRRDALPSAVSELQQHPTDSAWHERVVSEFELQLDRQLGLYRTMTRIGPLLGLMGTLIPLGPALVALAAGDISLLARKMEVAFATTVVGLVIRAIGFLLYQAANRWAMDDLSLLEYLSQKLRDTP